MSLSTLMFVGLVAIAAENTDKKYTLDLSQTIQKVKAGQNGFFYMHIKPKKGFKVSAEAPLRIKLAADGLKLHKTKLGHKDAKDAKSTAPEFGVRFDTDEQGAQRINVDATFFVCDESICERKQEKVTVAVNVEK